MSTVAIARSGTQCRICGRQFVSGEMIVAYENGRKLVCTDVKACLAAAREKGKVRA